MKKNIDYSFVNNPPEVFAVQDIAERNEDMAPYYESKCQEGTITLKDATQLIDAFELYLRGYSIEPSMDNYTRRSIHTRINEILYILALQREFVHYCEKMGKENHQANIESWMITKGLFRDIFETSIQLPLSSVINYKRWAYRTALNI